VPRDTPAKMFATLTATAPATTYPMTLNPIRFAESARSKITPNQKSASSSIKNYREAEFSLRNAPT